MVFTPENLQYIGVCPAGQNCTDLITPVFKFLLDTLVNKFLLQSWIFSFAAVVVMIYIVGSIFGKPSEFQNARF